MFPPLLGKRQLTLIFLLYSTSAFADVYLTTITPASNTVVSGKRYFQMKCTLMNACSNNIKWYKDDLLIVNSETYINGSISKVEGDFYLDHRFVEKDCTRNTSCTIGDASSCLTEQTCLLDFFGPETMCCTCYIEYYHLALFSVTLEDAGIYRCEMGNETLDFQLIVTVPLQIHVDRPSGVFLPKDDNTAEITCFVEGVPLPRVHFEFDDRETQWNIRREHLNAASLQRLGPYGQKWSPHWYSYTLLIKNVTDRAGTYKCVADNGVEKKFAEATLGTRNDITPDTLHSCCESRGVTGECLDVCRYGKRGNSNCTHFTHDFLACAWDESDHTRCCEEQGVLPECLPRCRNSDGHRCDVKTADIIMTCYVRGHVSHPVYPENLRSSSFLFTSWITHKVRTEWEHSPYSFYQVKSSMRGDYRKVANITENYIDLEIAVDEEWYIEVRVVNAFGESQFTGKHVKADYSPKYFIILTVFLLLLTVAQLTNWNLKRSGKALYLLLQRNKTP